MKLKALRVCEVGCFADPVAIENISDGLNLLVSENETGKSTLVHALRAAFTQKHTGNNKAINLLRPYGGRGAARIEVDFDIDQTLWRLAKQFHSRPFAELGAVHDGGAPFRNADAEAKLAELLLIDGQSVPLNSFWLAQQDALNEASIKGEKDGDRLTMSGLLKRQISDLAGGDQTAPVRTALMQRLNDLAANLTGSKAIKPKAHGEWEKHQEAVSRAEEEHKSLLQRQKLYEAQKERFSEVVMCIDALTRGEGQQRLQDELRLAKDVVEPMRIARLKRRELEAKYQEKRTTLKAVDDKRTEVKRRIGELAKTKSALVTCEKQISSQRQQVAKADENLARIKEEYETVVGRLETARSDLQLAIAVEELTRLDDKAKAIKATLVRLEEIKRDAKSVHASLQKNSATEQKLEAIERTQQAITSIDASLSAAMPEVVMSYQSGVSQRLYMDGRAIEDGEVIKIDGAAKLEIPGMGTLRIVAGSEEERHENLQDLTAHQDVLAQQLAEIGAADLKDARAMHTKRLELQHRHQALSAQIAQLAPDGEDALQAELVPIAQKTSESKFQVNVETATREECSANIAMLEPVVEKQFALLDKAQRDSNEAHRKLDAMRATVKVHRARESELGAKAQKESDLDTQLSQLETALVDAKRDVGVAEALYSEAQHKSGDEATYRKAETAFEDAHKRIEAARYELDKYNLEKANLEGQLAGEAHTDFSGAVAESSKHLEDQKRRLADIKREIDALLLLRSEFEQSEQRNREKFLGPVYEGLKPYINIVFPEADVQFSDQLSIVGVIRNGIHEEFPRVSDGTREQLAILARMGFARMFHNMGFGLPLVLDDPLVYADDKRLLAMFNALKAAAQVHQVIVLSCRENAFSTLDAQRLNLTNWKVSNA